MVVVQRLATAIAFAILLILVKSKSAGLLRLDNGVTGDLHRPVRSHRTVISVMRACGPKNLSPGLVRQRDGTHVEIATLRYVDWFNINNRLYEMNGDIPPVELELCGADPPSTGCDDPSMTPWTLEADTVKADPD